MSFDPLEFAAHLYESDRSLRVELMLANLFLEQQGFINDPAKRKAALCSRRAGKSWSVGAYLIKELLSPTEGDVAYIGLTRKSAKSIMFRHVRKLNEKYNLGLTPNIAELTFSDPASGNTIFITGAHNEDDTEKLRGLKFKLVALDECASFKAHLRYLIEDVLDPTLIDLDGALALIGTASANPHGNYFHAVTEGKTEGFAIHRWTILQNPYIRHAARWLQDYRARKGWTVDHPVYRREWMGEWATDGDTLVYRYRSPRNDFGTLPAKRWHHVLGVDIGYNDAFAVVCWAFSKDSPELYCVDQFRKSEMTPGQMAQVIQTFRERWSPRSIVADYGGLGKAICEEFIARYHIPMKPAEKQNKLGYIELMNGDLEAGLVKVPDNTAYANEMQSLQWDPDKRDREDPRTPNDMCDAGLYGYREAKHYLGKEPDPEPGKETKEYWDREAKRMEEADAQRLTDENTLAWWEKS